MKLFSKPRFLDATELGMCALLASVVFFAVEIEKWLVRRGVLYRQFPEEQKTI